MGEDLDPSKLLATLTNDKLKLLQNEAQKKSSKLPKEMEDHKFWDTQPVVKNNELVKEDGQIEEVDIRKIRKDPYQLPSQFEWFLLDLNDELEMKNLYELLSLNYVEDDDAMFRFNYTSEFLKWALLPPGWKKEWHLGVRVKENKKLVAFISGIPAHMRIRDHEQQIVEINFLCVHKKLRQKRLAPVLIKEITRRVNLFEIFQAVYTAGCYLPKPLCTSRYYHRNLNPKKLIDVGFSYLPRDTTMARQIKNYQVPKETFIKGFRKMEMKDCKQVLKLLNDYFKMKNLEFYPVFTLGDIKHWFLPIENVVYTYVVENPKTHLIDQFVSFYNLPSSIIKHPVHKILNAAYLFYYVPKKFDENESPREGEEDISIWEGKYLKELMKDALISAKLADFDVFNCLDILDNHLFLDELKFGRGDGSLHYYMYNYRCRNVLPEKLGLVML